MERGKIKIDDRDMTKALDHIYNNALGNPIIFNEAPTKEQMKANTMGQYGSDIYLKTGDGKLIKLTGVEV